MNKDTVKTFVTQNIVTIGLIGLFVLLLILSYLGGATDGTITTLLGIVAGLIGSLLGNIGNWWKAQQDVHSQLRMAALDKRLCVHQEAYAQWRELFDAVYEENISEQAEKARTWWYSNCLYLTPEARKAFLTAIVAASTHARYLKAHADGDLREKNWAKIEIVGPILEQSVSLPSFADTKADMEAQKAKRQQGVRA